MTDKPTDKGTPSGSGGLYKPEADDFVNLGVDANLPFSNSFDPKALGLTPRKFGDLYELTDIEYQEGPTTSQLVAMRRMDGQARALYRLLTLPILAALPSSSFVPAQGGEEEAKFISDVFSTPPHQGGMTVTFHRFMSQQLMALFDGFAAFEKVFYVPEYGPLKGKVVLKKLAYRPSDTVTFVTTEDGSYAGFRQKAMSHGKVVDVYIPAAKSYYFAAQEEERKFRGVSFFQSAFYHYDKKCKLYFASHLAAQRAAVGTRVGTVPSGASAASKRKFSQMLANLSFAQYMMMPTGYEVSSLKEGGSYDFLSMINHHNSQMSKSILASFFDKDQGTGRSESSVVSFDGPSDDMFVMMLRSVMNDIADQINHYIIPQLIDFNFKTQKYPKFTWGRLTDAQREGIFKTFEKLSSNGSSSTTVTPEMFRELEKEVSKELGLGVDYIKVTEREEKEQQQAVQQMLMEAQHETAEDLNQSVITTESGAQVDPDSIIEAFEETAADMKLSSDVFNDLLELANRSLEEAVFANE